MSEPTDILVHCGECGCNFWFGITADPETTTLGELEESIREKLGGAEYICPRCNSIVFVHFGTVSLTEPDRLRRAELARRIGTKARGVRFGVGRPDGERSAVWRVWMNNRRDDVYIAARGLASDLKVSLHPDYWYFGFTEHHVKRSSRVVAPGEDRKKSVWERPPEFAPGWTRAFDIVVPASEVVEAPRQYEGSEAIWLPKPSDGRAYHFNVLLSKPDAPRGRRGFPTEEGYEDATELITRLNLSTGESLWVLAHHATLDDRAAKHINALHEFLRGPAGAPLRTQADLDPLFRARTVVFGDQSDGSRAFLDLAVDLATHA